MGCSVTVARETLNLVGLGSNPSISAIFIATSSNGRTPDSDSVNGGSTPPVVAIYAGVA